jgi:anti-sigma B factor antagonist
MFIEDFDIKKGRLAVRCGAEELSDIPGYITTLIIVAEECGFGTLVIRHPGGIPSDKYRIIDMFIERNTWISLNEIVESDEAGMPIFTTITRNDHFLFLRENDSDSVYSILIPAKEESVDLAARTAYLVANVMGFPGSTAYEIRFGVYEILMNVIEHNYRAEDNEWVQIQLERKDRSLSVSIIDTNKEFDPTSAREFDLEKFISSGKRRGLGLILMKKMYESFRYERKNGLNRVVFNSSIPFDLDGERKNEMPSMKVGEFVDLGNGMTRIELSGDLDARGALVLEELMQKLLENRTFKVVLDFEKVPFISSAGIGMLLGMTSTLRDEGGEVWLTRTSQQVLAVFALLNLDDFFLLMDEDQAVVQE